MPDFLLDIDPDKLFQTKTVSEVEEIQQKIINEVERKKEDLRTLVGERYRDLIEAADSIKEMKLLSENIIIDVESVNKEVTQLNSRCSPYKPEQPKNRSLLRDSVAAQISILLDLPEYIWEYIDNKDYIKATHLYLIGRHIKTGFSVDKNLLTYSKQLSVIDGLWSSVSHFSQTITIEAENGLKQIYLNVEEASNCLACLAILQDTSLVTKFLQLRTEALNKILSLDNNVKERILDSCHCIYNTLALLHGCFLENWQDDQGLLWEKIYGSKSNQRPITLLEDNIKLTFLPPIIQNFKVTPLSKSDAIDVNTVKSQAGEWLNEINKIVYSKGKILLNNVSTLQALNSITCDKNAGVEWDRLVAVLNLKDKFNIWDEFYKPLIVFRAKELISIQCEETYRDVTNQINTSISEEGKRSDLDLRWFVWKEAGDDVETDKPTKGIFLKSKGITPKVTKICSTFEEKLCSLYSDLSGLYSTENILDSESNELKNHQQVVCTDMIKRLIAFIRTLIGKGSISESNVSTMSRFLQAVPDLCPTLHKCLMLGENKENAWQTLKLLNSESLYCWSVWEGKVLQRIENYIPEYMKKPETYSDLLNSIPQWDITKIDDDEKSQIKVPSAPSFPLHSILQHITTELSRAHVPRLISENLLKKIVPLLLNSYKTSDMCQAESLQNLFDVKYIHSQFVSFTNAELGEKCQEKIKSIESNIDPIDLEVFTPLIKNNVKSAVLKTQGMFGMAFRSEDAPSIKMTDDACILALSKSTNNVWFPLLPLTNPSNRLLHTAKAKSAKVERVSESLKTSGSSGFFSDWF